VAFFELVTDPEGESVVWQWLEKRAGCAWSTDSRAIGLERDRKLVAAVGYNGFQGGCCQMHVAIEQMNRAFLKAAFHWPFERWGLNAVIGLVTEGNTAALRFDLNLGFREVYRVKDGGRGEDLIVLEMRREDCRFIGG
jgi:RimJ/RimL family protein N-acetyltransferase